MKPNQILSQIGLQYFEKFLENIFIETTLQLYQTPHTKKPPELKVHFKIKNQTTLGFSVEQC
jgi:hypothetical protein